MTPSSVHFVITNSSPVEFPEVSEVNRYAALSKLETLAYRIRYTSNLLSAARETISLASQSPSHFHYFCSEILGIVEIARNTLEKEKVMPYLWARCPEKLVSHKSAYLDLLRMLQRNERYVDTASKGRLKSLTAPLVSKFCLGHSATTTSGSVSARRPPTPNLKQHEASSSMPPPTLTTVQRPTATNGTKAHDKHRRLWDPDELLETSSVRSTYRPKPEAWAVLQENDDTSVQVFRPARSSLRFGICFSAKLSLHEGGYQHKERANRRASVRSLMNPKE
ncbi:hypothetical protein NLJ89_g7292 [Agrocybe chaxingu]|uniref:Uncharacterized protein n=1 Tax=Agrocybe chaxingu TaxID=84603 RepID=A0A9W8JUU4_9AGAR|nr:hypothetical protein NLJ89_g7292 [Agrocybe chaxingu]